MQPKKIDCTEKNLHTFIDKAYPLIIVFGTYRLYAGAFLGKAECPSPPRRHRFTRRRGKLDFTPATPPCRGPLRSIFLRPPHGTRKNAVAQGVARFARHTLPPVVRSLLTSLAPSRRSPHCRPFINHQHQKTLPTSDYINFPFAKPI